MHVLSTFLKFLEAGPEKKKTGNVQVISEEIEALGDLLFAFT